MSTEKEKTGEGCRPFRSGSDHQISQSDTKKITRNGWFRKGYRSRYWLKITAGQRFNEIARLVTYRQRFGLAMGDATAWAVVLANLIECLGTTADVQTVGELCRRIGLPSLDPDVVAPVCKPAEGKLLSQAYVGALLEVTALERQDCGLLRIEACDEPAADRRRRLDRERKRRVRRTIEGNKIREADRRQVTASPRLRRLRSSISACLPSSLEPHPFFESLSGKKDQGRTATGVAEHRSDICAAWPQAQQPNHNQEQDRCTPYQQGTKSSAGGPAQPSGASKSLDTASPSKRSRPTISQLRKIYSDTSPRPISTAGQSSVEKLNEQATVSSRLRRYGRAPSGQHPRDREPMGLQSDRAVHGLVGGHHPPAGEERPYVSGPATRRPDVRNEERAGYLASAST